MGAGRVRDPGTRAPPGRRGGGKAEGAIGQGELGPEDGGHPRLLCRLGETHHSVEPVVVGQRQGFEAEPGGLRDQLFGVGGAVEKAEVRMTVELRVPDHPIRLVIFIEHMFVPLRPTMPSWILSKLSASAGRM